MTRPLIGVTTSRRGGWRSFLMHRLALLRVGARAVRLVAGAALPGEDLAGLVIGGGDDIGAEIYGGAVLPDVRIDPERDKLELKLLETALPAGLPVLGICRGSQMINVALGGSLHADIYEIYARAPRMRTVLPKKTVHVVEGSRLHRITRCNPCRVNALHHQSVDRVGRGLRVVARDEIGIVQAVEGTGPGFLLGVQWHPELLPLAKPQQRLFAALAEAARGERAPVEGPALSPSRFGADALPLTPALSPRARGEGAPRTGRGRSAAAQGLIVRTAPATFRSGDVDGCPAPIPPEQPMSKPLVVSIPHSLGRAEATRRLKSGLGEARQKFGSVVGFVDETWTGDHLDFKVAAMGQTIGGRLDVADEAVRLEVDLPWILSVFAEKAKGMIRKQGTLMLEKK